MNKQDMIARLQTVKDRQLACPYITADDPNHYACPPDTPPDKKCSWCLLHEVMQAIGKDETGGIPYGSGGAQ